MIAKSMAAIHIGSMRLCEQAELHLYRFAVAVGSLVLAACGGADGTDMAGDSPRQADVRVEAGAAHVLVEGCVATGVFTPQQATVQAVSADGRLISTSQTNENGVFALRVPVNTQAKVSVLEPDSYSIDVAAGTQPIVLGACLRMNGAR